MGGGGRLGGRGGGRELRRGVVYVVETQCEDRRGGVPCCGD